MAKKKKLLHPLLKLLLLLPLLLLKHLLLPHLTLLLPLTLQPLLLLTPPRQLLPSNWNQLKKATFGWLFFCLVVCSGLLDLGVCLCEAPVFDKTDSDNHAVVLTTTKVIPC